MGGDLYGRPRPLHRCASPALIRMKHLLRRNYQKPTHARLCWRMTQSMESPLFEPKNPQGTDAKSGKNGVELSPFQYFLHSPTKSCKPRGDPSLIQSSPPDTLDTVNNLDSK